MGGASSPRSRKLLFFGGGRGVKTTTQHIPLKCVICSGGGCVVSGVCICLTEKVMCVLRRKESVIWTRINLNPFFFTSKEGSQLPARPFRLVRLACGGAARRFSDLMLAGRKICARMENQNPELLYIALSFSREDSPLLTRPLKGWLQHQRVVEVTILLLKGI